VTRGVPGGNGALNPIQRPVSLERFHQKQSPARIDAFLLGFF
jgi:hypothetical protein